MFSKITFDCFGADKIHTLYRESKNTISVEINFPNKTALLFPAKKSFRDLPEVISPT